MLSHCTVVCHVAANCSSHLLRCCCRSASSEPQLYKLPRYIPGASELYDFLQASTAVCLGAPGMLRLHWQEVQ